MAKRITFDIEIIETLYISLRQITAIDWRGSVEWHTRTWMMWITLLKTTQWMIFAYHRKWKEPIVEWHTGGASWKQNANAGNDSGNWGKNPTIESEFTV